MRHYMTTLLLAIVAAPPAWAQSAGDSAAFVIRLGTDTLGIERYVRQGDRYEATIVTRSPRTTVRRLGPGGRGCDDGQQESGHMVPHGKPSQE